MPHDFLFLFIPRHTIVAGYYGFTLVVRVSVRPSVERLSVFSFPDDNLSECQWIFTKLGMCIDIVEIWFLWLLMGKFRQFLTELSARDTSEFSFPGDTLRKHAYSNILKILPPKNENYQIKNSNILHISAQTINCGYSLEPPRRGGSNEYP